MWTPYYKTDTDPTTEEEVASLTDFMQLGVKGAVFLSLQVFNKLPEVKRQELEQKMLDSIQRAFAKFTQSCVEFTKSI